MILFGGEFVLLVIYVTTSNHNGVKLNNKVQTGIVIILSILTYLGIPIFIKVIYACDTPSIAVGIIYVAHVSRPVSRVTRHHCLNAGKWEKNTIRNIWEKQEHKNTKTPLPASPGMASSYRSCLTCVKTDTRSGCSLPSCRIINFKLARK